MAELQVNRILVKPGLKGIREESIVYISKCVEWKILLCLLYSYMYLFLKCEVIEQYVEFRLDGLQISLNKMTP